MKLIFKQSVLSELKALLDKNPTAETVELTEAEYIAVYEELVATNNSNCILISSRNRSFRHNGIAIEIIVK